MAQAAARRRVLLVDDSPTLRKLVGSLLSKLSLDVATADNGLRAVEAVSEAKAEGRPFEMVLMDVVMPELNGCEATYQLREGGYRGKIIILTASEEDYDLARSLSAGADDFLAKPFGPAELSKVIHHHLIAA